MLISISCLMVMVAAGTGTTWWMSDRLRLEERLAVGAVVGAFTLSAISFAVFLVAGMGWLALGAGLVVPSIVGAAGIVRHRAKAREEVVAARRRVRRPWRQSGSLRPLLVMTAAGAIVSTRTLSLAYQTTEEGLSVGSLAVWGDWSAHLAYGASFAYGDNRTLDLPIAAGTPFRYHFLADYFGSLFTVSGATLQQSMVLTAWILAIVLPVLIWCAVRRLTGSERVSGLTTTLFILSGGIGWWYFLRAVLDDGSAAFRPLRETYARMPDVHLWVDNTISASLYAQRSTLMAICAGFAALILLLAARPSWTRHSFLAAGLLLGATGITSAHTLMTGLALGSLAWWRDRRWAWACFVVPAAAIGLPMVWAIRPETNSMRWLLGWMAPAAEQPWPWFWFRNVGLLLPLFAGISLFGGVPRRIRRLTTPLWLWFVVPNLVAFHPSEWNNTKFFLFWQFAGSLAVASWMVARWSGRRASSTPTVRRRRAAIAVAALSMIGAGGLDAVRAMQRSTAIFWVDADDLAAAAWLRANSDPDDVIVYGATNTSAVAALGGRRSVSGYVGWTYDLGLVDWVDRRSSVSTILRGAPGVDEAVDRYEVTFVVIGPSERRDEQASDDYWVTHGSLVFTSGEHRIYRTSAG